MNWSAPTDPDAPQAADSAAWAEAFRGIQAEDGSDLAEQLAAATHHGRRGQWMSVTQLQGIGERILNMQTLIEQNATVRVDGSELVMARTQREAAEAVTRQAAAGTAMGAQINPRARVIPEGAAAKIEAARAARKAAGEPDREHDRNTIESNPLGGDR